MNIEEEQQGDLIKCPDYLRHPIHLRPYYSQRAKSGVPQEIVNSGAKSRSLASSENYVFHIITDELNF